MHGAGDDWLNTELVDGKVWVQPKSCISACSNGATGNFTHAPTTLTSLHAVHMWVFPVQRCIAAAVRACVALQQAFQCTVSCIWLLSRAWPNLQPWEPTFSWDASVWDVCMWLCTVSCSICMCCCLQTQLQTICKQCLTAYLQYRACYYWITIMNANGEHEVSLVFLVSAS